MGDKIKLFSSELDKKIVKNSKVFIVGHNELDFDAIGSAIGLYALTKKSGAEPYIIVNDDKEKLEPGVKKIIDTCSSMNIIDKNKFLDIVDDNSILIVTDTNKKELISVADYLDKFKDVVIIDHHFLSDESINASLSYVNLESSSASEIVTQILNISKTKYDSLIANYLLAGICLDTDRFKKNTSALTHDIAEKLINHGAEMDFVNGLFLQDFESYCHVASLIIYDNTIRKIYTESLSPVQVSFSLNRKMPKSIYLKEDCAKAADRMIKFIDTDASFVMCYVDPENVHISARGGKRVNVGKIMENIGGGGNYQSAGAKIKSDDIFLIEKKIMESVPLGISSEETIIDNPVEMNAKQLVKKINK